MGIEDFLAPRDALVGVIAADKTHLLVTLCAHAGASLEFDPAHIAHALMRREELGSTGVGNGIAIPHTRLADLPRPFGLIARLARPIAFDAIDHAPVDLVFVLLQPTAANTDLSPLAAIARKLRETERLKALRAAPDGEALFRALAR